MLQPRKLQKLHLFNCDRTYKLDAVVDLLNATKAKSRFVPVEKHYFSLAEMPDMSTKTIPKLDMDLAFFVVHAHESRLSINEDNAGIGYAKIYRALLKATGGSVIIIIGGDDNYANEDEEDRFVISQWAKRKISSQFSEEFLDGRKGFIFSWNKKHRPIHEEALTHFFGPSKKGVKFDHQPTQRKLRTRPITPPPTRSTKLVPPFNLYSTLPEGSLKCWRDESFTSSSTVSRARKYNVSSVSDRGEGRQDISQLQPDIWKTKQKDLAILDCGVSDESMKAVRQVFNSFRSTLGVSTDIAAEKCSPASAKSYLVSNALRFCVLMVDAKTVKDVYESWPQRRAEYEDLLRTAANKVVEKVILVICRAGSALSLKDEAIFTEKVGGILQDTGKGIIVWMNHGKITIEPDVLVQMIMAPLSPFDGTQPRTNYRDDRRDTSQSPYPDGRHRQEQTGRSSSIFPKHEICYRPEARLKDQTVQRLQGFAPSEDTLPPAVTRFTAHFNSKGELIVLKTRLRHGNISYEPKDIDVPLYPGFIVPSHIQRSLYKEHMHTPEAVVELVQGSRSSDEVRWSVTPKPKGFFSKKNKEAHPPGSREHHHPKNETVVLKTRVRYGEVSMKENDLKFIYPDWYIPQYLIESLRHEHHATPDAKLLVISDMVGNLRFIVETDLMDEAMNLWKKTKKKFTD